MGIIYQGFSLILALVGAAFLQVRHLQMLQQNSYFASRYFGWLKSSFSLLKILPFVAMIALLAFGLSFGETTFTESMPFFSAIALWLGVIALKKNNSSIKKLVFTARIKRTLAFTIFLLSFLRLFYLALYTYLGLHHLRMV